MLLTIMILNSYVDPRYCWVLRFRRSKPFFVLRILGGFLVFDTNEVALQKPLEIGGSSFEE